MTTLCLALVMAVSPPKLQLIVNSSPAGDELTIAVRNNGEEPVVLYFPGVTTIWYEKLSESHRDDRWKAEELEYINHAVVSWGWKSLQPRKTKETSMQPKHLFNELPSGDYTVRLFYSAQSVNSVSDSEGWGERTEVGEFGDVKLRVIVSRPRKVKAFVVWKSPKSPGEPVAG
jgi:hypothetical protein